MKLYVLLLLLQFTLTGLAQEPTTPAPVPQVVVVQAPPPSPSAVQNLSDRITTWTTVGLAALAALGTIGGTAIGVYYAFKTKIQAEQAKMQADLDNMKDRQDRQAAKTGQIQSDVTRVAIAAGVPPSQPPVITPPGAALALLLCGALAFTGCSSIGSTTTSLYARDGKESIGVSQTFTFRDPHKTGLAK